MKNIFDEIQKAYSTLRIRISDDLDRCYHSIQRWPEYRVRSAGARRSSVAPEYRLCSKIMHEIVECVVKNDLDRINFIAEKLLNVITNHSIAVDAIGMLGATSEIIPLVIVCHDAALHAEKAISDNLKVIERRKGLRRRMQYRPRTKVSTESWVIDARKAIADDIYSYLKMRGHSLYKLFGYSPETAIRKRLDYLIHEFVDRDGNVLTNRFVAADKLPTGLDQIMEDLAFFGIFKKDNRQGIGYVAGERLAEFLKSNKADAYCISYDVENTRRN